MYVPDTLCLQNFTLLVYTATPSPLFEDIRGDFFFFPDVDRMPLTLINKW